MDILLREGYDPLRIKSEVPDAWEEATEASTSIHSDIWVKSEWMYPYSCMSESETSLSTSNAPEHVNGEADQNKSPGKKSIPDPARNVRRNVNCLEGIRENRKHPCEESQKIIGHAKRQRPKRYRCHLCTRSFVTVKLLEVHRNEYHSTNYIECSICNHKYKSQRGLTQHETRVHSICESKFECDYCGDRFKLKIDVCLHIKRKHMYFVEECRFCGKSVRDRSAHERIRHQGRKVTDYPHACSQCTLKFESVEKLYTHVLGHANGFRCSECGIRFSTLELMTDHKIQKHKPASCVICNKPFSTRRNMYQHVLTYHSNIKPQQCDICGEAFRKRNVMLDHRSEHPGPLPPIPRLPKRAPIAKLAKIILQKYSSLCQ
ncbi:zinc finger protein 135-like [Orussus abietinus]|uniref:zinc finger protein 135-like n=1 Tax=Orussus abietinus TaxID=222816 RepID=UPI0006260D63|nr:zinc finger protein 135-like [Orussus abietinus]